MLCRRLGANRAWIYTMVMLNQTPRSPSFQVLAIFLFLVLLFEAHASPIRLAGKTADADLL